ncbi:MAG: metallophosphoesterase family protein [Tidjanibacter sp.]|nr:metallophosphoesterase family protein [Tidjanibacter sp.]
MKRIGIISDTHGIFDERLRKFLSEVDEIWCAGDIGSLTLANEIAAFKSLKAVWGNIDDYSVRYSFPEFQYFETEGVGVLITHIGFQGGRPTADMRAKIRQLHPKIFVSGHSHILKVFYDHDNGVLCINPGAAGAYGFHRVRTAIRLEIDQGNIGNLEVWELPRQ